MTTQYSRRRSKPINRLWWWCYHQQTVPLTHSLAVKCFMTDQSSPTAGPAVTSQVTVHPVWSLIIRPFNKNFTLTLWFCPLSESFEKLSPRVGEMSPNESEIGIFLKKKKRWKNRETFRATHVSIRKVMKTVWAMTNGFFFFFLVSKTNKNKLKFVSPTCTQFAPKLPKKNICSTSDLP